MLRVIITVVAALALAACSDDPQPVQQAAQPAPVVAPGQQPQVVVQQAPQQSGMGDMLIGGAIGYMLGSSGQRTQVVQQPTQVIERHTTRVIEKPVASAPAPAPSPKPAAAPTPAPKSVAVAPVAPPKPATPNYSAQSSYNVRTNAPSYSAPPKPQTYSAPTTTYRSSPSPSRGR